MKALLSQWLLIVFVFSLGRPAGQGTEPLDTWHTRNQPAPVASLNGITFANGLFAAVGESGDFDAIRTSPDGVTWTRRDAGTTSQLRAVAYGNDVFVAVGARGYSRDGAVMVSPDGALWISLNYESDPLPELNAVAWGDGLFVAVGFDDRTLTTAIVTSTNAIDWTRVPLSGPLTNSGLATCVTFGAGIFAAATFVQGQILISTNGLDWMESPMSRIGFRRAIAYGNGSWVVTGGSDFFPSALITASPDLIQSTNFSVPGGGPLNFPAVTFGNGTFVVAGNRGNVTWSLDGAQWTFRDVSGSAVRLAGLAYGNGTFVVVGPDGTILQSDDVRVPRLSARGLTGTGFSLTVQGEVGRVGRLQAAPDLGLSDWTDLLTFTNTTPVTNFVDTDAINFNRRFYRVVSP